MTGVLRRLRWSSMTADERRRLVDRDITALVDPALREQITALVADVRERGDAAVCDALARFDRVEVTPDGLRVSDDEWEAAGSSIEPDLRRAIATMVDHVRRFNERLLEQRGDWSFEIDPGLVVGEKVSPIASAGLFCPSGKASYPSVLAQLGGPAVAAGVPEIRVVVPPKPGADGAVDPVVLAVARALEVREVFRVNGPAGVAALAFGTESIGRVVKVMGPGSLPVTVAQLEIQRWGTATVMALGPTESLAIADASADPVRLAADLMIEAEHGTDGCTILVCTDATLIEKVDAEIARQIVALPDERAAAVRASLGTNGGAVLVDDLDVAATVANAVAPEHLQVAVADPDPVVAALVHAGEILIGQHTPFSAANFVIGVPASLPTNGFARVSSGVTAESFLKRTAVARADEVALRRLAADVTTLADVEGFPAHGNALRLRFPD